MQPPLDELTEAFLFGLAVCPIYIANTMPTCASVAQTDVGHRQRAFPFVFSHAVAATATYRAFFFANRVMTIAIFDKPALAARKSFDKTDNSFVIFRNVG
ncbi:hypothetical protein ACTID9_06415 [Brevibacillus fluminis]|uniref:hypothetical protein n=1 Tax=Brevibacillus fluminis TaxID=511487 RepID=UPI003F8AC4E3